MTARSVTAGQDLLIEQVWKTGLKLPEPCNSCGKGQRAWGVGKEGLGSATQLQAVSR